MVDGILPPRLPKKGSKLLNEDGFVEPTFTPPDKIKETEPPKLVPATPPVKPQGKIKKFLNGFDSLWGGLSPKKKILLGSAIAAILIGACVGAYMLLRPEKATAPTAPVVKQEEKKEPEKPTTEPSRLTGLPVPPERNKLPVIGVMIENSPDARPQSGLYEAGVVFEAVAEGGITRFLALFQDTRPSYIGPVRSARPYYLRWLLGFDAPLAHVGGSAQAIADIDTLNVKDMDQFHNAGSFHRVSSRYAPHNVYTSFDELIALAKSKGWTSSSFTSLKRKVEAKSSNPNATQIDIDISSFNYNVHYDYSKDANRYKRALGGKAHTDEKVGKQIAPKVVIVMVTDKGLHGDGIHSLYRTLGSGQVFVFQDGRVRKGTWHKQSEKSQITFEDSEGKELKLNPGQTWITVVGTAGAVSYSP